ncbi:Bug family tripartite tricarboxylate transporter substrate binding protein [Ramlibacter sp.]|uniref:Bug family tripartite tricarboxylate transporter substrate binding protein n=1 Tax=Ramlibacter sp. TaxID=1917967 RepID=UPI003D0AC9DC
MNMKSPRRAALRFAAALAATSVLAGAAFAQAYPSRPIKLIVPAPPGGSTDVMSRALGRALSEQNNVPVVVENRAGAAGAIGIQAAIASPPDGYTITLSAADATLIYPMLKKQPPYNIGQLTPIAQVAYTSFLFVVPANSPYATLKEVIDTSKTKQLAYSSNGFGSGNHLWMEAFKSITGANLLHVPYKGAAPAVQGLIAGETQFMITSPASGRLMLDAGRMKPLATSNPTRLPGFPTVPTLGESGYPGRVMGAWFGIFGPANLPPAITSKLHDMVLAAMKSPEFQKQADTFMFDTRPVSRAAFEKVIADDAALLKSAIEAAKIPLED